LRELPVVEGGAVPQGEAGEEVVAIEGDGVGQERQAGRAHLRRTVAVSPASGEPLTELRDIEPERRVAPEADRLALDAQPLARQRPVQGGEGAPERGARAGLVRVGPEQRRER